MSFFKSMSVTTILLLAAADAAVLPQRRAGGLGCTPPEFAKNEFQNWQSSEPFTKDPVMGSPVFCISNAEDNCELSQGIAHTEGVEDSVEVSVSAGFTFAEVFELGTSVAYAHAWSSSDETSFGDTQLCPAGGMECGVVAYPKIVTVSGQVRKVTDRGCGDALAWTDFSFTAPSIENVSGSNGKGSTTFRTCLQSCGTPDFPDSCAPAKTLPICPSADPGVKVGLGNIGGTVGFIPTEQFGQPIDPVEGSE
ncbi:hypothetical protein HBH98_126160 [Parastagonospora nodorum]|nr:hypothetical protein HBI09_136770 [Parastagonospora nodorum]KAH4257693.1 hypothetical protein HBI03_153100 [Parastagonospora nodorum]KAH4272970.1 hypothetical protein HBI04_141430 [Parastagonospora nodorum]KAH4345269.1 hypothetical protein HBH98_126160 [Parastagonospora nodorum]KAH4375028.1 hypothetical protein HBH97_123310 [Parastagonospora nodorum]